MERHRPRRLHGLHGIGVDKIGNIADKQKQDAGSHPDTSTAEKVLRLENLDVDIPPDPIVRSISAHAAGNDDDNSYLPFLGQLGLRNTVADHVNCLTNGAVGYEGEKNVIVSVGGLSGILNVLLAKVEEGDGVLLISPVYAGLIKRVYLAGSAPRFVKFRFEPGASWVLDREQLRETVEDENN